MCVYAQFWRRRRSLPVWLQRRRRHRHCRDCAVVYFSLGAGRRNWLGNWPVPCWWQPLHPWVDYCFCFSCFCFSWLIRRRSLFSVWKRDRPGAPPVLCFWHRLPHPQVDCNVFLSVLAVVTSVLRLGWSSEEPAPAVGSKEVSLLGLEERPTRCLTGAELVAPDTTPADWLLCLLFCLLQLPRRRCCWRGMNVVVAPSLGRCSFLQTKKRKSWVTSSSESNLLGNQEARLSQYAGQSAPMPCLCGNDTGMNPFAGVRCQWLTRFSRSLLFST